MNRRRVSGSLHCQRCAALRSISSVPGGVDGLSWACYANIPIGLGVWLTGNGGCHEVHAFAGLGRRRGNRMRFSGERADDLPDLAGGDPRRLQVRPQGRVRRCTGRSRYQGRDQRARCGPGARQECDRGRQGGRPGPHRLLDPRRLPLAARHLPGDGFRRWQVAKRHVGGLRHAGAQGAQCHPVRRRRPVDGAPHGGPHALEGDGGRSLSAASLPSTTCRTWRLCRPPARTRS